MFGLPSNIELFQSLFRRIDNIENKLDNLTARINYLVKVIEPKVTEPKTNIIEPTAEKPIIKPTEPTITPTTPSITPTEDRAIVLQKYKDSIVRLQTLSKGSPEREQTLKEYRELKQKLANSHAI